MIGIIGPADSTRLLTGLAAELGLADRVVARVYGEIDEAPGLAKELDPVCRVLLFTGRAPYTLCRRRRELTAVLQYVPQSGADLYCTLIHLLQEFGGALPRVSLDTIEPWVVGEAYGDLALPPPAHLISLEVEGDEDRMRPVSELVLFHTERYRAGEVDVCLTCIGSVDRELRASGIPSRRISHTRSALREALRQAQLAERLVLTETTQPAAVLIRLPEIRGGGRGRGGHYEAQRRILRTREALLSLAERLQGRLTDLDEETFIVSTNRGTVEAAISRLTTDKGGPLRLERLPADARIGIGLGATVPGAEENARRALVMSHGPGDIHVAFTDGKLMRIGRDEVGTALRLREIQEPMRRVAAELGVGPLALARLTRALRQVDASQVTATELARSYGIEPRSARRLMTSLQRAGIATPAGRQGGPRAGRPQTVYRVDMARLAPGEEG